MDAAGDRGEERGQHQRHHLVERGVDAHRAGGVLVLADGDQAHAEAARRDPEHRQRAQHEKAERQFVEHRVVARQRQDEADIAAGDGEVGDDGGHGADEAQGRDGEIGTAQPQDRKADERRAEHGEQSSDREPDAEGQIELHHGDGRAVGAEPVEHGIAEGDIAGEAAEDVPRLRESREQQRVDAELDRYVIAEPGNSGQRDGDETSECDRQCRIRRPSARGRPNDKDQDQKAEADHVGIGRAEIEGGERLGDADGDAAERSR